MAGRLSEIIDDGKNCSHPDPGPLPVERRAFAGEMVRKKIAN